MSRLAATAAYSQAALPRRFLARFSTELDLFPPPLDLAPFKIFVFWHPRMRSDPVHTWLRRQVRHCAEAALASEKRSSSWLDVTDPDDAPPRVADHPSGWQE